MAEKSTADERYARYVLGVLVVVYVFNFLDRQILSILAERIKADLGLTDAQIGFLYGTAFAVFYAVFGIPLGRLADVWVRTRLIAIGLAFWSVMTALSAGARNFAELTAARIGVGVGEASASPAAFSILSDLFSPAKRATVLAIYSSGIYLGAGLGLGVGGLIVDGWDRAFAAGGAPLGLRGWQAAFLVVGSPGLLLAVWVATLREPVRGQSEGLAATERHPHPFREFLLELRAALPPFTVLHLLLTGAGGRALAQNLGAAIGCAAAAWLLTMLLGTPAQWIALGIGAYAGISWAQSLARRDPQAFDTIMHTPTLRWSALGFSLLAFTGYGVGFWVPPYFVRVHGVHEAEAGFILGGLAAASGWLGVTLGGLWSDRWRRRVAPARLYVGICTGLLPLPLLFGMLLTESTTLAYALNFPLGIATQHVDRAGSLDLQDLVEPRMRSIASAAYLMVVTFIGLALGPYSIGRLSVAIGGLGPAMLLAAVANLAAVVFLVLAARSLPRDQERLAERFARAASQR